VISLIKQKIVHNLWLPLFAIGFMIVLTTEHFGLEMLGSLFIFSAGWFYIDGHD